MAPGDFSIEKAKSGRASCKKCKAKIDKDDLRIGEHIDNGEWVQTKWVHLSCFALSTKMKKEGITTVESFVAEHLRDDSPDKDILNTEESRKVVVDAISSKQQKSKDKDGMTKTSDGASGIISKIKENHTIFIQSDHDDNIPKSEPPTKKVKKEKGEKKTNHVDTICSTTSTSLSPEELQQVQAYDFYEHYKLDELKDVLRWNRQIVGGVKDVILLRVIDGHINGRLGACPNCVKVHLKLSEDATKAYCDGYFDEELRIRKPCSVSMNIQQAPRMHPWYKSEPSEDEKKLMEEELKDGGADDVGNGSNDDITPKQDTTSSNKTLVAKIQNLDWNVASGPGLKKAATDIMNLLRDESDIDIPEDESKARQAIGKLIVENKSCSAMEIVDLVRKKYGLKAAKVKAEKKKTELLEAVCKVVANIPIYLVMKELSDLYFSERNTNAGLTYKKVSQAIIDLDFEITTENAKGLGKGKNKIAGIGAGSADKIYEFLDTGKIEKLEEKRAAMS